MECSSALVRKVPSSFCDALQIEASQINNEVAIRQHDEYESVLSKYLRLERLEPLNSCADSCFVEDTCVVVGKNAVICNVGASSRKGETSSTMEKLKKLNYKIVKMPEAMTCDGGDVLYTGKNLFVGMSKRTTSDSVAFLSKHLNVPAFPIKVEEGLHLKSCLGYLGPNVLSCWDHENAKPILKEILRHEKLQVIFTPSKLLANTLSFKANGKLVIFIQNDKDSKKFKKDILSKFPEAIIEIVDMSELALADGALTCCSVLLE